MEKQQKSGKDAAARGAQTISGVTEIARGIATQDYISAAVGAAEALPIKEIVIFIAVILTIVSIPVMVGFSIADAVQLVAVGECRPDCAQ